MARATVVTFWGGPDDGRRLERPIERRFEEPPEWWIIRNNGYRLGAVVLNEHDNSVHCAVYNWREVWGE